MRIGSGGSVRGLALVLLAALGALPPTIAPPAHAVARANGETLTRFRDATADAGLPIVEHTSWGAAAGDVDGDGWPDVLLNRHLNQPSLQRNTGAGFGELAVEWVLPMDRHTCAWGEANGDGRPDLFCSQGARRGTGSGPNELWLNLPDGMVEVAEEYGVTRPLARARTATWIDFDRDGDLDIFLGSAHQLDMGDVMFRNDRGSFIEVAVGVEGERNTVNATWADWTGEGYPDLLSTSGFTRAIAFVNRHGRFRRTSIAALGTRNWIGTAWGDYDGDGQPDLAAVDRGQVRVLRNDGGTFAVARTAALANGVSAVWVDLNNDGRLDLYVVQAAPTVDPGPDGDFRDLLLMQRPSGSFKLVRPPELAGWSGSGDSAATLDYDLDGRMDLLVSNGRNRWPGQTRLLENVFAPGNGAAIRLHGPAWNPLGIGARVRLDTARFSYHRQLNDGVAWTSQSDVSYVHLGLRRQKAASVTVWWPDGTVDCLTVVAGSVVELEIGSSPCP